MKAVFYPDPTDRSVQHVVINEGEVMLGQVLTVNQDIVPLEHAFVTINRLDCLRQDWPRVMLEPGDEVEVRLVPRGDDASGAKIAQTVITLTALVLAVIPGFQPFAAWIFLGAALINVGISLAFPPPTADFQQAPTRQTPLFTGTRNQLLRWEPVPWVVGKAVRIYPPYAAKPFTEVVGGQQFLRLIFAVHGGEADLITVADCKVGENALDNFDGVELQAHPGDGTTPALTLFTQDVTEEGEGRVLATGVSEVFTTTTDSQEMSLDILFPAGLFGSKPNGSLAQATFYVRFRYRELPSGLFTDMVLSDPLGLGVYATATPGEYEVRASQRGQTVRGFRFIFPSESQYEVEVTKYQSSTHNSSNNDTVPVDENAQVAVFRSVRTPTDPIVPLDVAHVALRILATDQLQGQLDTFSCLVTPVMDEWSAGSGFVQTVNEQNPSWNLLNVLRTGMGQYSVPDAQIDLNSFARFALFCSDNGYEVHATIKEEKRFADWANQIAATARGKLTLINGTYGVMYDGEQTDPIQVLTDRNSNGTQGRYLLPEAVHALRVRFEEKDTPGEVSERFVYADGYDELNATVIREVDMWGIGETDLAWRHGRYHLAASQLRRRYLTREMDWENLLFNVGDRVDVQMEHILLGGQPSRMAADIVGTKEAFTVTLDAPVVLEGGVNYEIQFRKYTQDQEIVPLDSVQNSGEYTVLTGGTGIPADPWIGGIAPNVQTLVIVGEPNLLTVPMVVNNIEHMDDLKARVELMDYNPGILTADQGTIPPWDPTLSRPLPETQVPPPQPRIQAVQSDETVLRFTADGRYVPRILVSFDTPADADATAFSVVGQYRLAMGDSIWEQVAAVPADAQQISFEPIEDGSAYDFRLRSVSPEGVASDWTLQEDYTAIGRSSVPPDPSTFRLEGSRLVWTVVDGNGDDVVVLDLAGYRIKYNFGGTGNWNTGLPAHLGLLAEQQVLLADLPNVPRTIPITLMLKLVDTLDNESENFLFITTTLNDLAPFNLQDIFALRDLDGDLTYWEGSKVNCTVDGSNDLVADTNSAGFWSGDPMATFWTGVGSNLFWTNNFLEMIYQEAFSIPLSSVGGPIKIQTIDIDGQFTLEYETSADPGFKPWPGEVDLAINPAFMTVRVTIPAGVVQGKIRTLTFVNDPPDVREVGASVFAGTGPGVPERLPITGTYVVIKEVFVTLTGASGAGTPVGYRVVDKNAALGPQVELLDAANAVAGGGFDWEVVGY